MFVLENRPLHNTMIWITRYQLERAKLGLQLSLWCLQLATGIVKEKFERI